MVFGFIVRSLGCVFMWVCMVVRFGDLVCWIVIMKLGLMNRCSLLNLIDFFLL